MRTAEIEINSEKHLLCFNLWALLECTERYGGLTEMFAALTDGGVAETTKETLWVLETLQRGGKIYADEMGISTADPISAEKMLKVCGADFFVNLKANIMGAINKGMTTNIEVESSKNAVTTQAD